MKRDPDLSADHISMNQIIESVINTLNLNSNMVIVQTHVTNPFLKFESIAKMLDEYLVSGLSEKTLMTVTSSQKRLWNKNGIAINHNPHILLQTQDMEPVYEENSCLYIFRVESFMKFKNRIGSAQLFWQIPVNEAIDIDNEIAATVADDDRLSGMGTTLTAIALYRDKAYVLHAGDSRAYRLRGKEFLQLTKDHSVVQELIDSGAINESEAATHPQRSVLTNVLMGQGNITPLLIQYDLKVGDKFLICSDGLNNVVSNSEIHNVLTGPDALNKLIALTYERGAPDNVTVLIAEVGTGETETQFFGAAK